MVLKLQPEQLEGWGEIRSPDVEASARRRCHRWLTQDRPTKTCPTLEEVDPDTALLPCLGENSRIAAPIHSPSHP